MSSNVFEWVNDWYDANYYSSSPASNPPGPDTGTTKVVRGGGFYGSEEWQGHYTLRTANRYPYRPSAQELDTGFRCAASSGE